MSINLVTNGLKAVVIGFNHVTQPVDPEKAKLFRFNLAGTARVPAGR